MPLPRMYAFRIHAGFLNGKEALQSSKLGRLVLIAAMRDACPSAQETGAPPMHLHRIR